MSEQSREAAAVIRERAGSAPIDCGLVLGSGLAAVADRIAEPIIIPYANLPGFPRATVSGHAAELVIGRLGRARVAALKGRAHYYESGDPAAMRVSIEALKLAGAGAVVLTNAAGAVRSDIVPGDVVLIRDHINLTGLNPLIGETDDDRFVDLSEAYDATLRGRFATAAAAIGREVTDGVYMWFAGPSFETPAEIAAAERLGADMVGMSTVPETILARRHGMRVLALSVITNMAAGRSPLPLSHDQTRRTAAASLELLTTILVRFFDTWVVDGEPHR